MSRNRNSLGGQCAPLVWLLAVLVAGCTSGAAIGQPLPVAAPGQVFAPGEKVQLPVRAQAERLHWRIVDYFGVEVGRGSTLVEAGSALIEPAVVAPGYYELEFEPESGEGAGTAALAFAIIAPPPAEGETVFGVMTHFAQGWDRDILPLIARAGIGHIRDEQYWKFVEPERGDYKFPQRYQAYVAEAEALGLEPLIVLSFSNPNYDDGQTPHSDVARAGFARYGRTLLGHYGDKISSLEVWNEYNGSFAEGPVLDDRPAYYAAMLASTYRMLKVAQPDVTVVGGAAVKVPLPWFEALFRKGALENMDAIAIHPYRRRPEGVEREIAALQRLVERHNRGEPKPIWVTEFGRHDQRPGGRHRTAAYLTKMATLLLSAGVERMYWYLMRDYQTDVSDFDSMGLLRDADSPFGRYAPNPAYVAYATVIRQLHQASYGGREVTDPRTQVHLFEAAGEPVRVAWTSGGSARLALEATGPITVVDIMGGERIEQPSAGRIELVLSSVPVYLRGQVTAVREWRPDMLIADSELDYSETDNGGAWRYGHYDGDGIGTGDGAGADGAYSDDDFEPLEPASDRWGRFWTDPTLGPLRVVAEGAHPARSGEQPVWAVRRWVSPIEGEVWIDGEIGVGGRGDGTEALILRDGVEEWSTTVGGPDAAGSKSYRLAVDVQAGTLLDFAVTPGAGTDVDHDATVFTAAIAVPLVADSRRDFSSIQGGHRWSYGHYDGDGLGEGDGAEPSGPYSDDDFERLSPAEDERGRYWHDPDLSWLRIDRDGAHPASAGDRPVWAVRRWIADRDATLRLSGRVERRRDRGDGTRIMILAGGQPVYDATAGGAGGEQELAFDLEVPVSAGMALDFAVTPGPAMDADFDAVTFDSLIR